MAHNLHVVVIWADIWHPIYLWWYYWHINGTLCTCGGSMGSHMAHYLLGFLGDLMLTLVEGTTRSL